jgi:hypothetical protein
MMRIRNISLKTLTLKTTIFLSIWGSSLYMVSEVRPDLIDWEKLVTSTYANTLAFLVAYILTVVGFRYSSNEEK